MAETWIKNFANITRFSGNFWLVSVVWVVLTQVVRLSELGLFR
jgi:hypothetical protein